MATDRDQAEEVATPLDLLLTSAAQGPLRRALPNSSWARLVTGLAETPGMVVKEGAQLAGALAAIATGGSSVAADPRDRRFTDPAWTDNPLLRRAMQTYLATSRTARELSDSVDLDWRDRQRVDFALDNLIDAAAPSNNPLLNPLGWRALVETRGRNVVNGLRNFAQDVSAAPRIPTMVRPDAFTLGVDIATSDGAVVHRTEVFELIQYTPTTPRVRTNPVVVVPPVINKFYVIDIAPGRSIVEYYLSQGQQMFAISWRNPDERFRDWDMDTYGAAILEAMQVARAITKAPQVHVTGICSGGQLTVMTLAHLAATQGLDSVASLALWVAVLDSTRAGLIAAIDDEEVARAAVAQSQARGYLDGRALAEVFAWLRPNDLVWNYWVNNYIEGKTPPAFDVLFWNADTTRMAAGLHKDFVELASTNGLAHPGTLSMLGTPVDLGTITCPTYIVAGLADHISPWQSCYRTTQMLGVQPTFVLSSSGHIASLVNPPTNRKASFRVSSVTPPVPEEFFDATPVEQGSWWGHYAAWLSERGGRTKKAPASLGGHGYAVLDSAPGAYVHDN